MRELWKSIPRTDGLYDVSNKGRIRSWHNLKYGKGSKSHIKTPTLNIKYGKGYGVYIVGIHVNGKRVNRYIHQLVLETFIGPCPSGKQTCHKDDYTLNNNLTNLYWGTPKQNGRDRRRNNKKKNVN